MKIRSRLIIYYSLLTSLIIIAFAVIVYFFYTQYRAENFLFRLKNKAINTAVLLINVPEVDSKLLKIIDENSINTIQNVTVLVLDSLGNSLYSNRDNKLSQELIKKYYANKLMFNKYKKTNETLFISLNHSYKGHNYIVLASGTDFFGKDDLKELLYVLLIAFVISILLIVFNGYFFSTEALKPLKFLIKQSESIQPPNLSRRFTIDTQDEVADLAKVFNNLLSRIENAFETEKSFIANVSHELRTPVTSIKGNIEVMLNKPRSIDEYQNLLISILEDAEKMKTIINGFLDLADANNQQNNSSNQPVRLDDLLFSVKENISKSRPAYDVKINFISLPEDEKNLVINGNKNLLTIMFLNLIENACKFSEDKKAVIDINFKHNQLLVSVSDRGIGIPEDELKDIFQPLYRAKNANESKGHGIGLAIVKKISEIHNIDISVESEINKGTTFTLIF